MTSHFLLCLVKAKNNSENGSTSSFLASSFIRSQISFGAMEYTDFDYVARHSLMTGMKETIKIIETTDPRAEVEFVIDPAQGKKQIFFTVI